ncbi:MAG: hypothetical protein IH614_11140 [Desulfuromonadales bacterium]|nr:hypothetical protein [Desulfuromonadales bacterium]
MELSALRDLLQNFETERVMETLGRLDVGQLVHNPYLLGGIGLLALLSLLMKWRLLLVTIMGLTGFVWLISYIQGRGTNLEGLASESLLLFVGGGVALIGLVIYYLFIKAE